LVASRREDPAGFGLPVAAERADMALPPITLVLGGARSGKSRYAESLIEAQPGAWIYVATAEARDAEMARRIQQHRQRRGIRWRTREAPLELVPALAESAGAERTVLVDCLTLWLANLMEAGRDVEREAAALIAALDGLAGPVVLVANEVGLGIVPDNALSRAFRDHAGQLNQLLAERAQSVVFIAAGLPVAMKPAARAALA
jgi:adenosylcobinamide kinase / adenosylcobinamide-phosphate guanylyltransferase